MLAMVTGLHETFNCEVKKMPQIVRKQAKESSFLPLTTSVVNLWRPLSAFKLNRLTASDSKNV